MHVRLVVGERTLAGQARLILSRMTLCKSDQLWAEGQSNNYLWVEMRDIMQLTLVMEGGILGNPDPAGYWSTQTQQDTGQPRLFVGALTKRNTGQPRLFVGAWTQRDTGQPRLFVGAWTKRDTGQPRLFVARPSKTVINPDQLCVDPGDTGQPKLFVCGPGGH